MIVLRITITIIIIVTTIIIINNNNNNSITPVFTVNPDDYRYPETLTVTFY